MLKTQWFYENIIRGYSLGYKIKEKLFSGKSQYQKMEIFETEGHGKLFTLDNIVMLTEKDEFVYHEMISHIPLCIHPSPKNVLVIGGGDGGTIREVVKHEIVENAILCEIDKMVVEESKKFLPFTSSQLENPKVKVVYNDGFIYLREHKNYFDVILVDSTDPIGEGEKLFSDSFYKLCYSALKEDGILVFQSETPVYNDNFIKDIFNNIIKKYFKIAKLYLAHIPMYPGGMWSFILGSKKYHPINDLIEERAEKISKITNYYNKDIHRASFMLPNFVKKLIE